ncbi:hypothetical protein ACLF6K_35970 [Streptomyces xanthophaeus]|uniref:hypothetical protein n=1 Tax=Streptomyces xanthophaeus TaxID=67385 RepID=UPI00398FEA65
MAQDHGAAVSCCDRRIDVVRDGHLGRGEFAGSRSDGREQGVLGPVHHSLGFGCQPVPVEDFGGGMHSTGGGRYLAEVIERLLKGCLYVLGEDTHDVVG